MAAPCRQTAIDQALARRERIAALLQRDEGATPAAGLPQALAQKPAQQRAQRVRYCCDRSDEDSSSCSGSSSGEDDRGRHRRDVHHPMLPGALEPIRAWREQRQRESATLCACFRGWLWMARAAQQRLGDAAADALGAARLARIFAAWRRHARVRRKLRERAGARARAPLPPPMAAALLRQDGKGGLAAAHFARSTAACVLRSWMAAAVSAHQPPG